mmetsp:Transcript_25931/g.79705  ORF Transcript_25931/g.79705 Transcript_25931/m.79705 type:complete len:86 (+) Transcript_25931:1-258(+)
MVDRTLCSEFQLLSELCDLLQATALAVNPAQAQELRGHVHVFVSCAPCLSCILAIWQFRWILPKVWLAVACRGRSSSYTGSRQDT